MRTKKISVVLIMLLCGMLLLGSFVFMPKTVYAEDSEGPNLVLVKGANEYLSHTAEFTFSAISSDYDMKLYVKDYNFSDGDSVAYYYLKQNEISYVYVMIGTIDYSTENQFCSCSINLYNLVGTGNFTLKAVVLKNQQVAEILPEFSLTLKPPAKVVFDSWTKKNITYDVKGVNDDCYEIYTFKVELENRDKKSITIKESDIEWWYTLDNVKTEPIVDEKNWSPKENGDYVIKAVLHFSEEDGGTYEITQAIPGVTKQYSNYAIIFLVGIGIVLTTIVIIATVRHVKKERVW